MTININNDNYEVVIQRKKKNKHTYLRVKDDLKLYVNTNIKTSDHDIKQVINNNIESLKKMFNKQINKNNINNSFFYLGKEYNIIKSNIDEVEIINDKIFIGKTVDIDKWFKKEAQIIFQNRLDYWYNHFDRYIPYPKLTIRKMSSRWGVCNTKDIRVTLNLELIKKDISCLDYVIVHELSHLIEANHSSRFWNVVECNYPNYKNIRKLMKNY